MASPKRQAAGRANGKFGGAPTADMVAVRRKARDKAIRIVAANQEEAVKFLVYVMNNPNAPLNERVRCALELLSRGEMPAKSGTYLGVGQSDELDAIFGTPKLVVLGKFTEKGDVTNGGSGVHPNGDATDAH